MATLTGPLNKSANTSGTTLVAKATTDTTYSGAIGDMLVLAFACNLNTATVTVADSAGNTWVQVDSASGGANNLLRVFVCRITVALPTNGTVTVTCTSVSRRCSQLYKISGAGGFLSRNKVLHAVSATTALSIGSFGSTGEADEYAFKFDGMTPAGAASGRVDATAGWTDKGTIDSGGTVVSIGLGSSFIATVSRNASQFANTATQTAAVARASIALSIRGISAPTDGLVQTFSDTGTAANTDTLTPLFAPTTGNTLIAVVATNENTGADDINTPTAWTLIGTVRNAAGTHVRMKIFGITVAAWIAAGSPAFTFTTTAAQRLQVTMGEFAGVYNLTAEATNTNEGTTGTSGTTGSVTPLGAGRLVIMAFAEKNAQPVSDAAVPPVFPALTVWNEDPSTLSTQKLNVFVGYVTNRGASATSISTSWSTTSGPWAGISVSLQQVAAADAVELAFASRPLGSVIGLKSFVSDVFSDSAAAPALAIPTVARSRPSLNYSSRGSVAVGAAQEEFHGSEYVRPAIEPARPFYDTPPSFVTPVYIDSVAAPGVWANVTASKRADDVRPLRSIVTPAYIGGQPVFVPVARSQRRVEPETRRSVVNAFFDTPAVVVDAWAHVTRSRAQGYYRGSYSAVFGAAEETPPVWAQVYQSRPYEPLKTRSYYAVTWDDHACTTLYPDTMLLPDSMLFPDLCPVVEIGLGAQSRPIAFYDAGHSDAIPVFTPNQAAADTWAAAAQSRPGAFYDVGPSDAVPVFTPNQAVADVWVQGAQSRVIDAPERPASQVILGATSFQDAYAAVYQAAHRLAREYGQSRVVEPVVAAAPAPGFAFVAMSRGTLATVARRSLAMIPFGEGAVIVSPNTGGGGEWIIWTRPDFPANRRGAWPEFNRPQFRKPTRRVP